MSGTISVLRFEHETVIRISGHFGYEMFSRFQAAYRNETDETIYGRRFIIDLAGTEYIDSSALGMLNVLRVLIDIRTGNGGASIEIINARPAIRKILETANMGRLLKIT
ncbi:MAG: STAS domain-containing protein [Magnetococcales bacterium]|nr:STAS domain-containing protein [Magnetococcales bacterium]